MYHSRSSQESNSLGPKEALAFIMSLAGESDQAVNGPEMEMWEETEDFVLVPAQKRNHPSTKE